MPCFPSLARAEKKTPPPCRGGGSKSRRGLPPTYRSAKETKRLLWPPQGKQKGIMAAAGETKGSLRPRKGNKRALWPPQGKQKGHYGRHKGNKRVVTTPQGEQKGRYTPVEVSPLRPFGARPPARRGSSFLPALTATFRSL